MRFEEPLVVGEFHERGHKEKLIVDYPYEAIIQSIPTIQTKKGDDALVAHIQILPNGEIIKDYFNLFNENEVASDIAWENLSKLVIACERPSIRNTEELKGQKVRVILKRDKKGYMKVSRYLPSILNGDKSIQNIKQEYQIDSTDDTVSLTVRMPKSLNDIIRREANKKKRPMYQVACEAIIKTIQRGDMT